ncbi:MAG: holin [Candidatus Omnitrophota bacterium]
MKKCPRCHKTYDDSWNVCLQCNTSLEDALEGRLQNLEEQAKLILKEIGAIRRGDAAPVLNSAPPDEKKVVKVQVSAIAAALAEDTEVRIGKYWLNKIGIISMVAGVAFFVSYAFKYLSPVWRIGVGYAIGAAMIFAGRLMDKAEKYKWYGRSVIAGGWVLAYFTTYAMYHIKATRILSSQPIDLLLLSAVMIVMVMHLFKYRVEGLVGLVMMLGFITAGISQYASFAFIYLAILAAAAGILLVKMKWQALGAFSLLGTYATHLIWRRSYDLTKSGLEEFWISIGFLVVYWSIYNIVSFFVTVENQKDRNILKGFILANSVLFGLTAFLEIRAYHADWKAIAGTIATATVASVLTSLVSINIGPSGTPSVVPIEKPTA